MLTKLNLMKAKLQNEAGEHKLALSTYSELLNHLRVEFSTRMNPFTHSMNSRHPKLIKTAKYAIITFLSMSVTYIRLSSLVAANECMKMAHFLVAAIFAQKHKFYINVMKSVIRFQEIYHIDLEEKCSMDLYITKIVKEHFRYHEVMSFNNKPINQPIKSNGDLGAMDGVVGAKYFDEVYGEAPDTESDFFWSSDEEGEDSSKGGVRRMKGSTEGTGKTLLGRVRSGSNTEWSNTKKSVRRLGTLASVGTMSNMDVFSPVVQGVEGGSRLKLRGMTKNEFFEVMGGNGKKRRNKRRGSNKGRGSKRISRASSRKGSQKGLSAQKSGFMTGGRSGFSGRFEQVSAIYATHRGQNRSTMGGFELKKAQKSKKYNIHDQSKLTRFSSKITQPSVTYRSNKGRQTSLIAALEAENHDDEKTARNPIKGNKLSLESARQNRLITDTDRHLKASQNLKEIKTERKMRKNYPETDKRAKTRTSQKNAALGQESSELINQEQEELEAMLNSQGMRSQSNFARQKGYIFARRGSGRFRIGKSTRDADEDKETSIYTGVKGKARRRSVSRAQALRKGYLYGNSVSRLNLKSAQTRKGKRVVGKRGAHPASEKLGDIVNYTKLDRECEKN